MDIKIKYVKDDVVHPSNEFSPQPMFASVQDKSEVPNNDA